MDLVSSLKRPIKYGMVIDTARCVGCFNCFLACRDEHAGNDRTPIAMAQAESGQNWLRIDIDERGVFPKVKTSYIPVPCLHCEDAMCIASSTDDAVFRRHDGIVIIDPEKAVGRHDIVSSCPHRVIVWNEALNVPQKCTLCAHLLDQGWKEPRCVEVCPTGALIFGDLGDPASSVARMTGEESTVDLHPEFGMKPAVRYRSLPTRFITGEVVFGDRLEAPACSVELVLREEGRKLHTVSDSYGDFEFDCLEPNSDYVLTVDHPGYRAREIAVRTLTDVSMGTIILEPI